MCLAFALESPDAVLARGEWYGFRFLVMHNGQGFRCGYVRLPPGHPWHGQDFHEIPAAVHGGLTASEPDVPCPHQEEDPCGGGGGCWLGFDAGHAWDLPDFDLPIEPDSRLAAVVLAGVSTGSASRPRTIKDTDYMIKQCLSLCQQACAARAWPGRDRSPRTGPAG
jgi:hypothetical protein